MRSARGLSSWAIANVAASCRSLIQCTFMWLLQSWIVEFLAWLQTLTSWLHAVYHPASSTVLRPRQLIVQCTEAFAWWCFIFIASFKSIIYLFLFLCIILLLRNNSMKWMDKQLDDQHSSLGVWLLKTKVLDLSYDTKATLYKSVCITNYGRLHRSQVSWGKCCNLPGIAKLMIFKFHNYCTT